jgi:hypothetical protein
LPPFKAATSQRGLFPLPAQVSFLFAGLRYLTANVLVLPCPFAVRLSRGRAPGKAKESNRCKDFVSRVRSCSTREVSAASTFSFNASNSSKPIELSCFIVTPIRCHATPLSGRRSRLAPSKAQERSARRSKRLTALPNLNGSWTANALWSKSAIRPFSPDCRLAPSVQTPTFTCCPGEGMAVWTE